MKRCAIGLDYGTLSVRAVLTDISEPSLKKARLLMERIGLADRVEFCVGDGAKALPPSS